MYASVYHTHTDRLKRISNEETGGYGHLWYVPFGELFIEERTTWNTPYKFSGKELDEETGYSYFGARYYDPNISIWLSVDPLSDKYPGYSPYNYVLNNPIRLVDPNGKVVSDHIDENGNMIVHYDDGDNSVYVHNNGTTKSNIDNQRAENNNTGGTGQKIGEIGGRLDVSGIMQNKLNQSSMQAKDMGIQDYFNAVKPGGEWDLKSNKETIFGVAWSYDKRNDTKTKFDMGEYSGLSAADIGNYHAGYTGRYTYGGRGMSPGLLWLGAGAAESWKSMSEGRVLDFLDQATQMFGTGMLPPRPPYGDRVPDFIWNTQGMIDADRRKR